MARSWLQIHESAYELGRDLRNGVEIFDCSLENGRRVTRMTNHSIAVGTEKSPNSPCTMAMVDVERPFLRLSTDSALTALFGEHPIIVNLADPIFSDQMALTFLRYDPAVSEPVITRALAVCTVPRSFA